MAIEFVGSRITSGLVTGTTPITLLRPSGCDTGDVLVTVLGGFPANYATIVVPDGWSEVANTTGNTSGEVLVAVLVRVVGNISSEPSSYTFQKTGTSSIQAIIACYRGVDNEQPTAMSETPAVTSGNTRTVTLSGVTDAHNSYVIAAASSSTYSQGTPGPAGMSKRESPSSTYVHMWDGVQPAAGPTGVLTVSFSYSGLKNSWLTALRPAGDSPPPPTAKPWTRAFIVE